MSIKFGALVSGFKGAAAEARRALNAELGGYVSAREVEVIASNADGRVGEPEYLRLGELTGARAEALIRAALMRHPDATAVSIELGFDAWESFGEYMQTVKGAASYDYTPRVDHVSVEVTRASLGL